MSKNVSINPLLDSLPESPTLAINQKVKQLRGEGKPVYQFGFGQAPFPIPTELTSAMSSYIDKREYLPSGGLPALKQAIAKRKSKARGTDISPDHICVGPGSKLILYLLLYTLDGPLILQDPCWVSYEPQAQLLNKEVHTLPTEFASGYKITPDNLETLAASLVGKQVTLILNSPNNPTGQVYKKEELAALSEVFRKHNIIVIWDEIYGGIHYNGEEFCSLASLYPEGTILTGGLSKLFSAGGYRLGYTIIPEEMPELIAPLHALISETFSCVNAPLQYATADLFASDTLSDFIANTCKIHEAAANFLCDRFQSMGLRCHRPQGAFYLFPDFSPFTKKLLEKGFGTSRDLGTHLLEEYGVAMLPGEDFLHPAEALAFRVASVDYDGGLALAMLERGSSIEEIVTECFTTMKAGCEAIENFLKTL